MDVELERMLGRIADASQWDALLALRPDADVSEAVYTATDERRMIWDLATLPVAADVDPEVPDLIGRLTDPVQMYDNMAMLCRGVAAAAPRGRGAGVRSGWGRTSGGCP